MEKNEYEKRRKTKTGKLFHNLKIIYNNRNLGINKIDKVEWFLDKSLFLINCFTF